MKVHVPKCSHDICCVFRILNLQWWMCRGWEASVTVTWQQNSPLPSISKYTHTNTVLISKYYLIIFANGSKTPSHIYSSTFVFTLYNRWRWRLTMPAFCHILLRSITLQGMQLGEIWSKSIVGPIHFFSWLKANQICSPSEEEFINTDIIVWPQDANHSSSVRTRRPD